MTRNWCLASVGLVGKDQLAKRWIQRHFWTFIQSQDKQQLPIKTTKLSSPAKISLFSKFEPWLVIKITSHCWLNGNVAVAARGIMTWRKATPTSRASTLTGSNSATPTTKSPLVTVLKRLAVDQSLWTVTETKGITIIKMTPVMMKQLPIHRCKRRSGKTAPSINRAQYDTSDCGLISPHKSTLNKVVASNATSIPQRSRSLVSWDNCRIVGRKSGASTKLVAKADAPRNIGISTVSKALKVKLFCQTRFTSKEAKPKPTK